MKRALTFLVLLITVATTFFPCCAFDNCADEPTQTSNQQKENGACSPFFACPTCPAPAEIAGSILIAEPPMAPAADYGALRLIKLPTFSSTLFQPPRSC